MVWITGLGSIIIVIIFVVAAWYSKHTSDTIILAIVLLLPDAWVFFYISQVRMVLQEIAIEEDYLRGKFFYGRKIEIAASGFRSISYYPMTWRIKQINLFDPIIPGINLELQDGTIIRINSRIEDFSQLVEVLKKFAKFSNQIICSL
jgi:hypothetical protein